MNYFYCQFVEQIQKFSQQLNYLENKVKFEKDPTKKMQEEKQIKLIKTITICLQIAL